MQLWIVIWLDKTNILKFLLQKKAKLYILNKNGKISIDLANSIDIIKIF